ncbi:MAG: hypothetical protein M3349_03590 [Actinomycetota bacterium]|nr:hypothetical protein [Actinomycetota bacterium]
MGNFRMIAGVVLVVVGLVWTLQGLDILGGSSMSGTTIWAVIGPVVAIAGAVLAVPAWRRRR